MEVQLFGDDSQLRHILLLAAWVGGDEVGDDLLVQVLLAVDTVEDAFELIELLERGFAHQSEHAFAGMLRGYLQASADMTADQFTGVGHRSLIAGFILTAMQEKVVAHTTADKALLDTLHGIDGMIDVEQRLVVGVEVRTDLRIDAAGTLTFLTGIEVASVHTVHIG